ncbi:hypothetical protein AOE01nite_22040 [Acetobacter oeni]|uniref:diguanylate cyclase n=1 Tax=Acetobacter oeni TaxID=304077 RepID=A0A511XM09_9PROT|nr:hypothetical protein AOE01nite_22040 [Acetobacter oeni]
MPDYSREGSDCDDYSTAIVSSYALKAVFALGLTGVFLSRQILSGSLVAPFWWWGTAVFCVVLATICVRSTKIRRRDGYLIAVVCGMAFLQRCTFAQAHVGAEAELCYISGWMMVLALLCRTSLSFRFSFFLLLLTAIGPEWLHPEGGMRVALLLTGMLSVAAFVLRSALQKKTGALYDKIRYLQVLSSTDELTGIMNRRAFPERVEMFRREVDAPLRYLLLLDLDNFKQVNDRHGHQAGDRVLTAVAAAILAVPGVVALGRLGGEEFGAVLEVGRDVIGCRANAVLEAVAACSWEGQLVSASAGGVKLAMGRTVELSLACADAAMYRSKMSGKGRFTLFSPETTVVFRAEDGTSQTPDKPVLA